jgi:hypothetical protein
LDAAVKVLDGGGAGIDAGEVLNEGGAGFLPRIDAIWGEGVEPLAIHPIHHEGQVAGGE